jgi:FMN phosphatase YigB (HAD superfamily)
LIDFLIVSEQVGIAKPEPAIFKAALDAVNCGPGDVVMVGDSWQSDVLGATRLGIRSVWFNRFGDKCPDPSRAAEITALEPLEQILSVLLGSVEKYPIKH